MPGKPITITKIIQQGDKDVLVIDHDVLSQLLRRPVFGKKPVSIVSIAGCMRSGKSFLLNFLLRYLNEKGWINSHWIGNDDTKAKEGLNWRGGRHPDTKGIIIWDEIFEMKKKNGETVALMIMDTQGLFDNNTTKEDNIRLFTMSTLMSSIQILNIQKLVQERDLENLQLCVEFALASTKREDSSLKLQTLLFLIRDWPYYDEHPYGFDGGQRYLADVLEVGRRAEELDDVRRHLRQSFTDLRCFLAPHPGPRVEHRERFQGANREIEKDFLDMMGCLVPEILYPENIKAKQGIDGPMTAIALLNLVTATDNLFREGQIPKVETMLAAQTTSYYSAVISEAAAKYRYCLRDEMKRYNIRGERFFTDEQLMQCGAAAADESLAIFDSSLNIGPPNTRKRYRDNLIQTNASFYKTRKERNSFKRERATLLLQASAKDCLLLYQGDLEKGLGDEFTTGAELEEKHNRYRMEALSKFSKEENKKHGSLYSVQEENLKQEIQEHFCKVKVKEERRMQEYIEANQKEREILGQIKKYSNTYKTQLQKRIAKLPLRKELTKFIKDKEDELAKKFKEETIDATEGHIEKLKEEMADLREASIEKNNRNWELFTTDWKLSAERIAYTYMSALQTKLAQEYLQPRVLEYYQQKVKSNALQGLKSTSEWETYTESMQNEAKAIVEKRLLIAGDEIKEMNQRNEGKRSIRREKPDGEDSNWEDVLLGVGGFALATSAALLQPAVAVFGATVFAVGVAVKGVKAICRIITSWFD